MTNRYKAYIDGSGTGDPNLLVLAGFVAHESVWAGFIEDWQICLNEAELSRFKMNEMSSKPEFAGFFYRVVEKHNISALSCAIYVRELVDAVEEYPWPQFVKNPEAIKNPYYFAFKTITDVFAQKQVELGIDEPVDFIFDEESEKTRLAGVWRLMKEASAPEFSKLMGAEPDFGRDEKILPLQAADLYAWWVRFWLANEVPNALRDLPFPWGSKKDLPRLHIEMRKNDFRVELEKVCSPETLSRALQQK